MIPLTPNIFGFFNMFGTNNNSTERENKVIKKKVQAIFAYIDRIDKEDESSDEE